jgi:hypothetical protein
VADAGPFDFFLSFDEADRERAVADLRADGWYVETSPAVDTRVVIASCLVGKGDERALDEAMRRRADSMGATYGGYAPSDIPVTLLRRREAA